MEQEIEEKLEEIYKDYVDVKFRDFGIYDVYLTLKGGQVVAVVFYYNAKMTFESNIHSVEMKIDSELINLFKRTNS